MAELCGLLNLNKPAGISSFFAARKAARIVGARKCGHTGTLDPAADGVLVVLLGRATKFSEYIMAARKTYRAAFQLGVATDTLDLTGEVTARGAFAHLTAGDIEALLPRFRGTITQTPPMYSAVQVDGRRLYDLARQGVEVEREAREVEVEELTLLSYDAASGSGELRIACGKGTYVRTLIDDLGRALGCGAAMGRLTRERNGAFSLEDAVGFDELEALVKDGGLGRHIVSIESYFSELPRFAPDDFFARLLQNGLSVAQRKMGTAVPEGELCNLYDRAGRYYGLAKGVVRGGELCLYLEKRV
ncbi:tRNA pseudouridine(55) synthase TruB [Feifania hominis]|uniref:tRNA pseudouridine synthase B n=1 Tax=Feifania hominis TaxID=2763660 RepID=A0A926HU83_9FIRM|nr:tRNA pseudouridine(55) synthase TruB [Feifania hominis]